MSIWGLWGKYLGVRSFLRESGILLAALSIAVSLALSVISSELILRFYFGADPFHDEVVTPEYIQPYERVLRWRLPSGRGKNRLGLPNREIGPKSQGVLRVLLLGDSMVQSGRTTSGLLFTEVLEESLNKARWACNRKVEVINAGVPGYTTYQEIVFLKLHGLKMEPDIVILGFALNDLFAEYMSYPTAEKLLNTEASILLNRFDRTTTLGSIFGGSYLAHSLVYIWDRFVASSFGRHFFRFEDRIDLYVAWEEHMWNRTRSQITELKITLKDRSIFFAIVVFPVVDQMRDDYRKMDLGYVLFPQRKLKTIVQDLGVPLLDLSEVIYQGGGTGLFRDYLHLTEKGNDLVAESLYSWLVGFHDRFQFPLDLLRPECVSLQRG